MKKLSQKRALQAVLAISVVASIGGIAYAVFFGSSADAQRGGAIAVAASFLALFAARNTPLDTIQLTGNDGRLAVDTGDHDTRIRILRTAVGTMIDSQRLEKTYLTCSSVFGTLIWGFGDLIALWLGALQ